MSGKKPRTTTKATKNDTKAKKSTPPTFNPMYTPVIDPDHNPFVNPYRLPKDPNSINPKPKKIHSNLNRIYYDKEVKSIFQ
jgi:hypothetical protein